MARDRERFFGWIIARRLPLFFEQGRIETLAPTQGGEPFLEVIAALLLGLLRRDREEIQSADVGDLSPPETRGVLPLLDLL